MGQVSSGYKLRYDRFLNVVNPVKDNFHHGRELEYAFFPCSLRRSGSDAKNRERNKWLSYQDSVFKAVVFCLKNGRYICKENLECFSGKPVIAEVFFKAVRDKLRKSQRPRLIFFCSLATELDLWHKTDCFFLLDGVIVGIDLTLDPFKEEHRHTGTIVISQYNLASTALNNLAEKVVRKFGTATPLTGWVSIKKIIDMRISRMTKKSSR